MVIPFSLVVITHSAISIGLQEVATAINLVRVHKIMCMDMTYPVPFKPHPMLALFAFVHDIELNDFSRLDTKYDVSGFPTKKLAFSTILALVINDGLTIYLS